MHKLNCQSKSIKIGLLPICDESVSTAYVQFVGIPINFVIIIHSFRILIKFNFIFSIVCHTTCNNNFTSIHFKSMFFVPLHMQNHILDMLREREWERLPALYI
jgi:hypothetical protein